MNRWIVAAALVFAAAASHAQVIRSAPADVKPARLTVVAPPQITLDGRPDRLSPGARIRGTNNLVLLSGSVVGKVLPVVYRRDAAGLVHEVWVLTQQEYDKVAAVHDGSPDGHRRLEEAMSRIFGARR